MKLARTCFASAVPLVLLSCAPPSEEEQAVAKAELEERIATVINLSGNLCAKVTFIGPVISSGEHQGTYQVNCDEYRDSALAKTKNNVAVYMVNPSTFDVRFMGRE